MEGERSLWVDQFERFDDFVCGVLDVRREDSRIVIRAEVVQAEGENKVIDLGLHGIVVQHSFILPLINQDIPCKELAEETDGPLGDDVPRADASPHNNHPALPGIFKANIQYDGRAPGRRDPNVVSGFVHNRPIGRNVKSKAVIWMGVFIPAGESP